MTMKRKRQKEESDRLTIKQRKFCEAYLIDYNGTQAYMSAYKGVKSASVAAVCASKMLKKPNIQAQISDLERNLAKTIGVSPVKIALEYKKLAFTSIAHLHNTWITRKEFEELTEDQKSCISEISTSIRKVADEDTVIDVEYVKIKLFDKLEALKALRTMTGIDAPSKFEIDFNQLSDDQLTAIVSSLATKVKP